MHIYLFVFQFFKTFKMALDMLRMSGSGRYHLNQLKIEVEDGNCQRTLGYEFRWKNREPNKLK
jgi:hypothetical protein